MRFWKKGILFYIGGMIYTAMELCWRGWSHWSMFLLGGLCFVLIGHLGELPEPLPLVPRAVVGAGIVTMLELGCGLLVNRQYQVWDYRQEPLQFCGQICLPFSLLWVGVSVAAIWLYDRLKHHLFIDFSRR